MIAIKDIHHLIERKSLLLMPKDEYWSGRSTCRNEEKVVWSRIAETPKTAGCHKPLVKHLVWTIDITQSSISTPKSTIENKISRINKYPDNWGDLFLIDSFTLFVIVLEKQLLANHGAVFSGWQDCSSNWRHSRYWPSYRHRAYWGRCRYCPCPGKSFYTIPDAMRSCLWLSVRTSKAEYRGERYKTEHRSSGTQVPHCCSRFERPKQCTWPHCFCD